MRMDALRAGLCKGAGRGGGGGAGGAHGCTLLRRGGRDGCRAASPRCARSQPPGVRGACAPAPRLLSLAGRQRATGRPRHGGAGTRQAGSGHRVAAKNCGSACAPGRARRPSAAPRPRSAPAGAPGLRKRRGPERGRGRDTAGGAGAGGAGLPPGTLAAGRAGSPRGSAAAAPHPLLPLAPLRGLPDPFSHPFPFPFLAPSAFPLPRVLLSSLPSSLVPPLPSLPGPPAHPLLPVAPSSPILLPPAGSCFFHFHPGSLLSTRWLPTAGIERDNKLGNGAMGKLGVGEGWGSGMRGGVMHRLLTDFFKRGTGGKSSF